MDEENKLDVTKLKYVLYARKSTTDEERQVRSIEDQISDCEKLAKDLGIKVITVLRESQSAKKPNKRPIFNQMIRDVNKGKYDAILSWNPDRLARNMLEGGQIINLVDEGILKDLKFKTHFFTKDANGKMLLGMAFVLSKQYSDDLSQKVGRGVKNRFSEGKTPTPKHGYTNEAGIYSPDGKNWDIICEAWRMRKQAKPLKEIVHYINNMGYYKLVKKDGRKIIMTTQILSEVFRDSFYYGVLVQVDNKVDLRTIYAFKSAVSENDFLEIQRMNRSNLPPLHTRKAMAFYPFKKIILCEFCNEPMRIAPSTSSSGTRFLTANCQNKNCFRRSVDYKGKRTCRINVMLDFVYKLLAQGINVTEKDYEEYVNASKELTNDKKLEVRQMEHTAQGLLKNTEREINERSLKIVNFDSNSTIYKENEKRILVLEEEKDKLTGKIEKYSAQLGKSSNDILSIEQFSNVLKSAESVVKAGTAFQKDVICRYIFSNVWIGDNKVTKYRFKPPFDILLKDPSISTGRGGEIRTHGLRFPKAALYQLSHTPIQSIIP